MESAAPPEAPAVAEAVPMVVEPPPIDTLAPAAPVAEPEPAVSAPVTDAGAAAPASVTVRVTQSAPPAAGDPGPYRQLKVEDALAYLDKVKTQFQTKPHIYNRFLEIMKAFKASTIDTPGVIKRVSELFKGHNNLILGFNTFLPPGYKIELISSPSGSGTVPTATGPTGSLPINLSMGAGAAVGMAQHQYHHPAMPSAARPPVHAVAPPVRTGPGTGPAEFDHAISYVTKIKKRFANDPATYKAFLEILHAYQKQQRNIKDVLERVSVLFKNHPDLLRDFTYFLPDAVQESAKDRIQRMAEANRQRDAQQAAQQAARMAGSGRVGHGGRGIGGGSGFDMGTGPGYAAPTMAKDRERARELARDQAREYAAQAEEDAQAGAAEQERDRERQRLVERTRDRQLVGMGPGKSPRAQVLTRRRRTREEELHLTLTPSERGLFGRIKAALGAREHWVEVLKCLDLYAAEVLSRHELVALLADVFGPANMRLLDELRAVLNARGTLEMTPEDVWFTMPVGEVDFSACTRCTPSYRALPAGYPRLACTERSQLERSVLNDLWVSVPTGSEDFSFKVTRKNTYEEALFRCEDERYEIDMVIDNNAAAIRALEPLDAEIAALRAASAGSNVEWQFRLDRRSLGVLHLKAIARVYGEYGGEVLELLRKNPAGAIPVVLKRLQQKDAEWRRAQAELNPGWKDTMGRNYYKSLDHRSFYFKFADRKLLTSKSLLAEMRAKVEALEAAVREYLSGAADESTEDSRAAAAVADGESASAAMQDGPDGEAVAAAAPAPAPAASAAAAPSLSPDALPSALRAKIRTLAPVMRFVYRDTRLHRDAHSLLAYAVEKAPAASRDDKAGVAELWRSFLTKFLQFPSEWLLPPSLLGHAHGFGTSAGGVAGLLQLGTAVSTPFGIGTIENVRVGFLDLRQDDAAPLPPRQAREAAAAAAAAAPGTPPFVAYHVMLPWGRAILGSAQVRALPSDEVATALAAASQTAIASGGAQSLSSQAAAASGKAGSSGGASGDRARRGGLVKPLKVDPAALKPDAAAAAAAIAAAGAEGQLVSAGLQLAEALHPVVGAVAGGSGAASDGGDATSYLRGGPVPPPESVFFCTSIGYAFFRLHQMLVDRLATARILCHRAAATRAQAGGGASGAAGSRAAAAARIAATAADAPGAVAAAHGHESNRTTAAAAAATGDLAAAAAAGSAAGAGAVGADPLHVGGPSFAPAHTASSAAASSAAAIAAAGDDAYDHFLSALYALIDGSMDTSKFEDECRELMGTAAYLLFTLDRLAASAAKQLLSLAHDPTSLRLRGLWEYAQARVALARRTTRDPAEAARAVAAAMEAYRANVAGALSTRGAEECFCVQYVVNPPELAPADVLADATEPGGGAFAMQDDAPASSAANAAAAAASARHETASLSIRYIGKPVFDAQRASVRGFQFAAALPAYLSRLVGSGRHVVLGDEAAETVDDEAVALEVATEAGLRARLPFLLRNVSRGAGGGSAGPVGAAEGGGGLAASAGLLGSHRLVAGAAAPGGGGGVAVHAVAAGGIHALVADTGKLDFKGEEAFARD